MRKAGILVVFVLILNLTAHAQTIINIEAARILGLTNSQEIANADASIRSAVLNERSQLYSMLPQVSAGYSAAMNFLETDRDGNHQFINPVDNLNSRVYLNISQNFTLGGNEYITRSKNKIRTDIARISSLSTYYKVLESIDNAYYSVLRAAASFDSAESSLRAASMALEIAEVRFNNGIINQIDYLRAQADKESRENTRNQNQRSLTLSLITLKDLIGVQGDIVLEPVNFNAYNDVLRRLAGISIEETDALYETLWNIMIANNPSLKTAALNSQIAEMDYSSFLRSEYMPTLSLDLKVDNILSYSSANGFGLPPSLSGSITFSGRIPVDFWNQSIKTENQERSRDNTLNNYSDQLRSSKNTLLSNIYDVLSQASSVLSSRRSLEISQSTYEYQMERYRLSQSSVKDIGDASISLMDSQNSLNNANYSFLQRLSTLRTLCAIDDEQQLINILLGK